MIKNFVHMRATTATVVTMIHPTTVNAWYGCNVNGLARSEVIPGGGGKPGWLGSVVVTLDIVETECVREAANGHCS